MNGMMVQFVGLRMFSARTIPAGPRRMDPLVYQRGAIVVVFTGLFLVVVGRLIRRKYSGPLILAGLSLMTLAAMSAAEQVIFDGTCCSLIQIVEMKG